MTLTDKNVRDFKAEYLWDDLVPGLGVRSYRSKKSFVVKYVTDKKHIETLGAVGVLSVSQAREIAKNRLINKLGYQITPDAIRTFSLVSSDYMELVSMKKKKTWEKDIIMLEHSLLPTFGNKLMSEIIKREIDIWHKNIPAKYSANRSLALLSTIFNRAIEWGDCKTNPCRGIVRNKEYSRDRYIAREKYKEFLECLHTEEEPYPSIIKLFILTGVRKKELLDLTWKDVDMDRGILTIKETKNGSPHIIPLSRKAIDIFRSIPKLGHYVFIYKNKKLEDIKKPWQRIRERFGDKTLRVHDLRRTFGSWLAQEGVSLQIIGELLNHKDPKTTLVYARLQKEHLRSVVEKI
jgi:integrase